MFDAGLANLLEDRRVPEACKELRDFNTDQVGAADRANREIVDGLTWGLIVVAVAAPLSGLALGYAWRAASTSRSTSSASASATPPAGSAAEMPPVVLEEPSDLPDLHRQMQGVIDEIERVVERLQQREREVLRAEQLAAVGQVAAGVAHELRNPLTSVKMLVQTGLEGPKPAGLPPDDLAIIEHEVRRMEACIQTFLDFARPPHAERRRTDLLEVVRRALALVEGRAPPAEGEVRGRPTAGAGRAGDRRKPDPASPRESAAQRPGRPAAGRDGATGSAAAAERGRRRGGAGAGRRRRASPRRCWPGCSSRS